MLIRDEDKDGVSVHGQTTWIASGITMQELQYVTHGNANQYANIYIGWRSDISDEFKVQSLT